MKNLLKSSLLAFTLTLSFSAHSTVDGNMNLFILVKDLNSEEFYVEKAPLIGCWGIAKGPELLQLTREYVVNNLGCGSESKENINALTCAKVLDSVESDDFSTFKEISLDISACDDKNVPAFTQAITKLVSLNFSTKTFKKTVVKFTK
jgi:hypothetical protein